MFTNQKIKTLLRITLVLLPLIAVAVSVLAIAPGTEPGIWKASSVQDCPDTNDVCTEWETYSGGGSGEACCQDASMVNSTVFKVCPNMDAHFRH